MNTNRPVSFEFQQHLKGRYSLDNREENEGLIEALDKFILNSVIPKSDIEGVLRDLIRTIHRIFEFEYIGIALRSKKDGLYRYTVTSGLSAQADSSYKEIAYSSADLFDNSSFPSIKVSRFTHFYLAEDKPFKPGEEKSYTRPAMLSQTRTNNENMMEGDYIDIFMFGQMNDILGYFELASTRSGKFPDRETIKWLELVALLTSRLLQGEIGRPTDNDRQLS